MLKNEVIKIGRDQKNFVSIFACFLTAIAKGQFLEGRLGIRLSPTNFRFF